MQRVHPITLDLPDSHFISIGKIVAHWTPVERLLQLMAYDLLDIGPKHGRVAVRSPRAEDGLNMIQQLMALEKIEIQNLDFAALTNVLRGLKNIRDLASG